MTTSPLILVTGAAGRLGSHVAKLLHENDLRVRATDIVNAPDAPGDFRQVNLLDHEAVSDVVESVEVVVHLGNHAGLKLPQTTFSENMAMNINVFQAAAERGVKKIIFASSVQTLGSSCDTRTVINPPGPLAYPLSGATPPTPANTYALSKALGEEMLKYYADRCGIDAVAIRFPLIAMPSASPFVAPDRIGDTIIREAFSWLSRSDAARLVLATVRADLPGFRIYFPGTSSRVVGASLAELIRRHLPHAPDNLENLIDDSVITRETGWRPARDPAS